MTKKEQLINFYKKALEDNPEAKLLVSYNHGLDKENESMIVFRDLEDLIGFLKRFHFDDNLKPNALLYCYRINTVLLVSKVIEFNMGSINDYDVNKMLDVVADETTNLEDKIFDCFDNDDIYVEIEDIDYESCVITIKNIELCKRVIINYHKLLDSINVFYVDNNNSTCEKDFKDLSEVLKDTKEFLNKEGYQYNE